MYKISIIAVGKLKEPFWKDAISEYAKRLKPYAKIEVVEVAEAPFRSIHEAPAVMKTEAEALERRIPFGAYLVGLDKEGRAVPTELFSDILQREGESGRDLAFLIGGPLGLDPQLIKKCQLRLSLSAMTFTHGEARAILFEQLYRAMTILSGKTYHY
jgi:23S rRNA (pseudouridine1915-N3)-methyltransferase